ncbi:MAG: RNA polymerase sigma factor, partial [Phycisphaerae bacterium]|nr:RNA polymerase sigma factor [Phycisphaerae bacterium]
PLREMQLASAHQAGDPEAMGELLRGYQRRIHAICYRMVAHSEEAADLTQDAIIKVMEGLAGYDGRASVSTWIIRVTMNCCLSHLRKERLRRHASLDAIASGSGEEPSTNLAGSAEPRPGSRVEREEERARLLQALGRLESPMRAVLVLRDLQGLDYQQLGTVLGIPVGTVKSRLFRARLALRAEIETSGKDDEAGDE